MPDDAVRALTTPPGELRRYPARVEEIVGGREVTGEEAGPAACPRVRAAELARARQALAARAISGPPRRHRPRRFPPANVRPPGRFRT